MASGKTDCPEKEPPLSDRGILFLIVLYALAFIVFGFAVSGPVAVMDGLGKILTARDTLLTDYIGVGGMGAAFVNAGLVTLLASLVYHVSKAKMTGGSIACLFLVLAHALFGKNILNIWGIVAGVFLYSTFKKEAFSTHINVAFFGTALSPVFSEILFSTTLPWSISIPLAVVTTLVIGFVLPPAAAQLFKAHMGLCLYNMGFTAGIVGTLVVALYRSYGFVPEPVLIWTSGNNALLGVFISVLFVSMIVLGCLLDGSAFRRMKDIVSLSGQSPTDFTLLVGIGPTLVNMGLTGLIGTAYVLLVGGDINGPTIGGIFSIVGFAAFGKHVRNILPIMAGVFLGSLAKPWNASDPSILLAALLGTNLAPIAGRFGWRWGIVAGFIHSSAVLSVGQAHGGLSLYNNGFAAGLVASVLVPVIEAIQSRLSPKDDRLLDRLSD